MSQNKKKQTQKEFCPYCGSRLEKYYSLESAAALFDVSIEFFRKRIRNREIGYAKFGKSVRIPASELEKCFEYFPSIQEEMSDIFLNN